MLRPTVEAVFEALDQPSEVALQFRSPLESVEEFAVADRRCLGLAGLVSVDVPDHELTEHFADRGSARGALEHLPGGVVNLDARHVVAPLRPARRNDGLTGGRGSPEPAASTTRHCPMVAPPPAANLVCGAVHAVDA